jgi:serine protease Do
MPSVVTVLTERVDYSYFLQPTPYEGAGSGVVYRPDGYVITNNHVVDQADSITVILQDGRILEGELWGADPLTDLAVIKIQASNLPAATMGDSGKLELGDEVMAIGNAFDLPGGHSVTKGIVSALGRFVILRDGIILRDLIQTDAAVNPGNSGGPLVDENGDVIGLNTAIVGGAENIGFAISTAIAVPVIDALIKNRMLTWPWLGIAAVDLTPAIARDLNISHGDGVLVHQVYGGGPAADAGLRAKDVIVKFSGRNVSCVAELAELIRTSRIGDTVDVDFVRNSKGHTATISLEQSPRRF